MNKLESPTGVPVQRMVRRFRGGIGFRCWHLYGKPHGTAIRWLVCRPGLFGVLVKDGGLHIGCWWQIRFETLAVHVKHFEPNS